MKKCTICGVRDAELPDRDQPGRPIKALCRQCHGERLQGDLERIMQRHQPERKANEQ